MAMPPMIRQMTKTRYVPAMPVPSAEMVNRIAANRSSRFRPKRSLSAPEITAPSRQPTRAQLFAQPTSKDEVKLKYFS